MTIRTRVLLVLSILALLPAILTTAIDARLLTSLKRELTSRTAAAMADQALVTLERIAAEYANVLNRETERLRVLVSLQADRAERLLSLPADESSTRKPRFDTDAAIELDRSRGRGFYSALTGSLLPVTWDEQVFHLPPSAEPVAARRDAARLAPLIEFFQRVRDPDDELLRWHYVVLDNGLVANYPGHAGYPYDFDPRQRPWYREQQRLPRELWFRPHFDASTGALVSNVTLPLRDRDGNFIGITGIDISLQATFDVLTLPDYLRAGSTLLLAGVSPPGAGPRRAVVVARQDSSRNDGDWHVLPELQSFSVGNTRATETVERAMFAGEDGKLTTFVDGREHFVLFRRFGAAGAYVVMIVPVADATQAAFAAARAADELTGNHLLLLAVVFTLTAAAVLLIALLTARYLTRPIEHLRHVVGDLAAGDFSARASIGTHDELQSLGEAFNAMVPRLKEHAHVQESLALAREVQQQLLPPAPPHLPGYDIAGCSVYSEQTGGDYFDYIPPATRGTGTLGVVIADVSGHGIGPSLLMATTRALLHGASDRQLPAGELLDYLNCQLADDLSRGHFVTLLLLDVEPCEGALSWASAGHDPALVLRANGTATEELGADDIPLGIDGDWRYSGHDGVRLEPGDLVLLGTDGIWETADANGARFGKGRLLEFLSVHRERPAAEIAARLIDCLNAFRGGLAQADDITLVVIKRLHAGGAT